MFGNCRVSTCGTARKDLLHTAREACDELTVLFRTTIGISQPLPGPDLTVRQTLLFGLCQCLLFHQQTLPFLSLPRPAPFQDKRGQRGVFVRAPCDGRIARGEEDQMIEVGAGEAKGAFVLCQGKPAPPVQRFGTFGALGISSQNEDLKLEILCHFESPLCSRSPRSRRARAVRI